MSATIRNPKAHVVNLDHDQLLVLSDRRGSCVEVLFGGVWLTEQNDPKDRFVEAGSGVRIGGRGPVVAEAIGRTGLRITDPAGGIGRRWSTLLGRLRMGRPTWAAQGVATMLALVMGVGLAELTAGGFQGRAGPTHASVASLIGDPDAPV